MKQASEKAESVEEAVKEDSVKAESEKAESVKADSDNASIKGNSDNEEEFYTPQSVLSKEPEVVTPEKNDSVKAEPEKVESEEEAEKVQIQSSEADGDLVEEEDSLE